MKAHVRPPAMIANEPNSEGEVGVATAIKKSKNVYAKRIKLDM